MKRAVLKVSSKLRNVWEDTPKAIKFFLLVILIPIMINLITDFLTWYTTKEKVEITLRLDGWITIGSIRFGDLPHLKLMLDSQEVKNITKVSWRVINTGDKGIAHFENGPFIEIPTNVSIVLAKISETSSLLTVSKNVRIKNGMAFIDSLGIFNPGDFFKIDFYLQNITEENIDTQYFETWNLSGKSLDLTMVKDISFIRNTSGNIESVEDRSLFGRVLYYTFRVFIYTYMVFFLVVVFMIIFGKLRFLIYSKDSHNGSED